MRIRSLHGRYVTPVASALVAFSCLAFSGFGSAEKPGGGPVPLTVTKAVCGPGDHPETVGGDTGRRIQRLQLQFTARRPKQGRRRELADH
jgi:hypothetical protein